MLPSDKRGAEIALNAIIIAVIVLVVAFVVIFIFVSKSGKTGESLESCAFKGGDCTPIGYDCPGPTIKGTKECTQNQVCCINVIGETKPSG